MIKKDEKTKFLAFWALGFDCVQLESFLKPGLNLKGHYLI
jgi:hypothetical protein